MAWMTFNDWYFLKSAVKSVKTEYIRGIFSVQPFWKHQLAECQIDNIEKRQRYQRFHRETDNNYIRLYFSFWRLYLTHTAHEMTLLKDNKTPRIIHTQRERTTKNISFHSSEDELQVSYYELQRWKQLLFMDTHGVLVKLCSQAPVHLLGIGTAKENEQQEETHLALFPIKHAHCLHLLWKWEWALGRVWKHYSLWTTTLRTLQPMCPSGLPVQGTEKLYSRTYLFQGLPLHVPKSESPLYRGLSSYKRPFLTTAEWILGVSTPPTHPHFFADSNAR